MREIASILAQVGARLKEERKRIDRSQAELGGVGRVNRDSQAAYEAGKRAPDVAYLLSIQEVGIDLMYLLSGRRETGELNQQEADLLSWFRLLEEADRSAFMHLMRTMARAGSGS